MRFLKALKVLYCSYITIPQDVCYQEFDEDEGWEDVCILAGTYKFRVLEFRGWRPIQILVDDVYIDCPFEIIEKIEEEQNEHSA